jgi:hypothetical protein
MLAGLCITHQLYGKPPARALSLAPARQTGLQGRLNDLLPGQLRYLQDEKSDRLFLVETGTVDSTRPVMPPPPLCSPDWGAFYSYLQQLGPVSSPANIGGLSAL